MPGEHVADEPVAPVTERSDEAAVGDLEDTVLPIPGTRRAILERAETCFAAENYPEARGLFETLRQETPMDREVLSRLLTIAERTGDEEGELFYLPQLGDAWCEDGDLAEALRVFARVLRLDPENGTARRRVMRLREMGVPGAESVLEESRRSIAGVLDTAGAHVVASDRPGVESDEWVDLGELLHEFQAEVKKQIDGDDYQSHYDLAVSHRSMGLHEETLEELDLVLSRPELPFELAGLARELRGTSLMEMQRYREAVHEFREALEMSPDAGQRRWTLLYHLGCALEAVGEWREAVDSFDQVLRDAPAFLDAAERRNACSAGSDRQAA